MSGFSEGSGEIPSEILLYRMFFWTEPKNICSDIEFLGKSNILCYNEFIMLRYGLF